MTSAQRNVRDEYRLTLLVQRNATFFFYNRIIEHDETYPNGVCQGWAEPNSPVGHHKWRHPLDPFLRCRGRHGKSERVRGRFEQEHSVFADTWTVQQVHLEGDDVDVKRGVLELKWSGDIAEVRSMEGIACNLKSPGLQAIVDATAKVKGKAAPYAITGSLPLVQGDASGRLRHPDIWLWAEQNVPR